MTFPAIKLHFFFVDELKQALLMENPGLQLPPLPPKAPSGGGEPLLVDD